MDYSSGLPTGPRLGKIKGDLDQAQLLLEAMAEGVGRKGSLGRDDGFIESCLGAAAAQIRDALANVDLALAKINAPSGTWRAEL